MAQTCDFNTNYYYQLLENNPNVIQQSLTRICDYFTNPLFNQQSILSQIKAIHQQYKLSFNDDQSRLQQIDKLFMKGRMSRFNMGNQNTLYTNDYVGKKVEKIKKYLQQFYCKFYQNQDKTRISVVIYSGLNQEYLQNVLVKIIQNMANCMFNSSSIKQDNQINQSRFNQILQIQCYNSLNLQKCVQIKSISNQDIIKFQTIINLSSHPLISQHIKNIFSSQNSSKTSSIHLIKTLPHIITKFTIILNHILCHPSPNHNLCQYLQKLQQFQSLQQYITSSIQIQSTVINPYLQFVVTIVVEMEEQLSQYKNLNKTIEKLYVNIEKYLQLFITETNIKIAMDQIAIITHNQKCNMEIQDYQDYVCQLAQKIGLIGIDGLMENEQVVGTEREVQLELYQWIKDMLVSRQNKIIFICSPDQIKNNVVKYQPYLSTMYAILPYPNIINKQTKQNNRQMIQENVNIPRNPLLYLIQQNQINSYQNHKTNNTQTMQPQINSQSTSQIVPTQIPSQNNNHIHIHYLISNNTHNYNCIINNTNKCIIKVIFHNNQSYVFNKIFTQFMDLYIQQYIKNYKYAEVFNSFTSYFDYVNGSLFLYVQGSSKVVEYILQQMGKQLGKFVQKVGDGRAKKQERFQELFQEAMEGLLEDIDNYYQEEMDQLVDKLRDQVLIQSSLPLHMLEKQSQKIKKNKFLQRSSQLLKQSITQWIIVGNISQNTIINLVHTFQQRIQNKSNTDPSPKSLKQTKVLNLSQTQFKKPVKLQIRLPSQQIKTSTCLTYYQIGMYTQELFWIMEILRVYLDQPYYHHCRVEKNLAYDLQVNVCNTRGVLGIQFFMTSSKVDPEGISKEIQAFLKKNVEEGRVREYFQKNLDNIKRKIVLQTIQQFSTLQDLFDYIDNEITNRTYNFFNKQNHNIIYQKHQKLTIDVIVQEIIRIFSNSCLEIMLVSKDHKKSYAQHKSKTITLEQIKSGAEYYKDRLNDLGFRFGR